MSFSDDMRRFSRELEEKVKRVEDAMGSVPLPELMPPAFVQRHTRFSDLQEMVDAAPGSAEAVTDEQTADYLRGSEWDGFVSENSDFSGWNEMLQAATLERVRRAAGGK